MKFCLIHKFFSLCVTIRKTKKMYNGSVILLYFFIEKIVNNSMMNIFVQFSTKKKYKYVHHSYDSYGLCNSYELIRMTHTNGLRDP